MTQVSEAHGNVDVALAVESGKVVMTFHQPTNLIVFDPQNAFNLGEALARTAHRAKFGKEAPSDNSYIAQQVKARITEQMRDKMVTRVAQMLRSMMQEGKLPAVMAVHVVDTIFAEVA